MSEIQGQEPTPEDDLWLCAARDLAPGKSLQRINDKVAFIFTNLTLAGFILAGAGVITGVSSKISVNPVLLKTVITLVFVSVAAALVANLPSMQWKINPSDIQDVRRFFEHTIVWKGWLTRSALLLFTAALLLAFILVIGTINDPPTATLAMQWTRPGSGTIIDVHATVNAERLAADSVGQISITAFRPDGTAVLLSRDVSGVDPNGQFNFSADLTTSTNFRSVVLSMILRRSGKRIESRSLTLNFLLSIWSS